MPPPPQTFTPPTVPGVCNSYLPDDTILNRFLFVINFFAQNNFYIILDNQFNLDQTAINNEQQWLQRVRFRAAGAINLKGPYECQTCISSPCTTHAASEAACSC